VLRLNAISLGLLLDLLPVKRTILVVHHPKPAPLVLVVVLAALKVLLSGRATVLADGPEVVLGHASVHNRHNTVGVPVLVLHLVLALESSAVLEVDATLVHQLLALVLLGVDRGITVQTLDLIVRLHVLLEVHVSEHDTGLDADHHKNTTKRIPRILLLVGVFHLLLHKELAQGEEKEQELQQPLDFVFSVVKVETEDAHHANHEDPGLEDVYLDLKSI